ncbi:MAG: sulfur carrier protein ThiS [Victivallaceae bacterium]|nr:sulfur carrier protein ThiS [Victivallaceae bacterium]
MNIYFNDKTIPAPAGVNLADFLLSLKINLENTVIELNDELVERKSWTKTILTDNDKILAVSFVGGG